MKFIGEIIFPMRVSSRACEWSMGGSSTSRLLAQLQDSIQAMRSSTE